MPKGSKLTYTIKQEGADVRDVGETIARHPAAVRTERTEKLEDGSEIVIPTFTIAAQEFFEARANLLSRYTIREIKTATGADLGGRPLGKQVDTKKLRKEIRSERSMAAAADNRDMDESSLRRVLKTGRASRKNLKKIAAKSKTSIK